ncbi:MAG: glycosyltransferase [Balneolaceae bacterium]|nr:glycosyltransferase [Balneolaceae bacterium]
MNNQISEQGLENYVSLLGFKKNPYPFILHSDIFVMSSLSEGLPTVLCEAMILGIPPVVTNCSGCRGLVDYGTYGLMTKPTPESLFGGLKSMIDDSELRYLYSQKAKKRSKLFKIEHVITEYEKILNL